MFEPYRTSFAWRWVARQGRRCRPRRRLPRGRCSPIKKGVMEQENGKNTQRYAKQNIEALPCDVGIWGFLLRPAPSARSHSTSLPGQFNQRSRPEAGSRQRWRPIMRISCRTPPAGRPAILRTWELPAGRRSSGRKAPPASRRSGDGGPRWNAFVVRPWPAGRGSRGHGCRRPAGWQSHGRAGGRQRRPCERRKRGATRTHLGSPGHRSDRLRPPVAEPSRGCHGPRRRPRTQPQPRPTVRPPSLPHLSLAAAAAEVLLASVERRAWRPTGEECLSK